MPTEADTNVATLQVEPAKVDLRQLDRESRQASVSDSSTPERGKTVQDRTMQAIRQETLGGPEVLKLVTVPRPVPGGTEVLVRVHAPGVNPVDWKTRQSGGHIGPPPFTVGWESAGVVEEVGRGVTRFAVDDRVFGMPNFPHEAAGYAPFVRSRSRHLALTPDGLDDIEAAALPLSSLIAWQSLVETASVEKGG